MCIDHVVWSVIFISKQTLAPVLRLFIVDHRFPKNKKKKKNTEFYLKILEETEMKDK